MAELFADIYGWLEALPVGWAYAVILLIAYGENVLPPIPGDMVVVFGGYLVGRGMLEFVPVVALSTVGGALGFMSMYALGRRIGPAVLAPDRMRWLPKREVRRVERWLQRWGYGVVAVNRFLSGARSVIALTVGIARKDAGWTAVWASVSALVWTLLITWAGWAVGDNWPVVEQYLRSYGLAVTALLVVALGIWWWRRKASPIIDDPGA